MVWVERQQETPLCFVFTQTALPVLCGKSKKSKSVLKWLYVGVNTQFCQWFTQTHKVQTHMISIQFVSMSPRLMCLMSLHDEEGSCALSQAKSVEGKQSCPCSEASLSQQEAVKTCWANVRRGSERLAQDRGHKSGSDSSGQTPCYDDANMTNAITDPSVKEKKKHLQKHPEQNNQMFSSFERHSSWLRTQEGVVICWLMT